MCNYQLFILIVPGKSTWFTWRKYIKWERIKCLEILQYTPVKGNYHVFILCQQQDNEVLILHIPKSKYSYIIHLNHIG